MGRATAAIGWYAAAVLMTAAGCSSTGSGVAEAPDVRSDAGLEPPRVIAGPALSGATECEAAGGQCEVGAVCGLELAVSAGPCGPAGAICCGHVLCAADATVQLIKASDYDQSCSVDSDCIAKGFGDPCTQCLCPNGAINVKSEPQYEADLAADLARTPLGHFCFCGLGPWGPCCVDGMCQVGSQCPNPLQPADAGAETGRGSDASDAGADLVADVATHAATDASSGDAADAAGE